MDQKRPAVGRLDDKRVVFVWEDRSDSQSEILARIFDAARLTWGEVIPVNTISAGDQTDPAVAGVGRLGFVVAFASRSKEEQGNYRVFFRRFDPAGNPLDAAESAVQPGTPLLQTHSDVAAAIVEDGGTSMFSVVFSGFSETGGDQDVFLRRFSFDGTPLDATAVAFNGLGSDARTAGDQGHARVAALRSGGFAAVYEDRLSGDVLGVQFDAQGNPVSVSGQAAEAYQFVVGDKTVDGWRDHPDVAARAEDAFVVAYNATPGGLSTNRHVQAELRSSDAAIEARLRLGDSARRWQDAAVVRLDHGGFAALWQTLSTADDPLPDAWKVQAQGYEADATPSTPTFTIHPDTPFERQRPALAPYGLNGFIGTWESRAQDGSGVGVFARRLAPFTPGEGRLFISRLGPPDQQHFLVEFQGVAGECYVLAGSTNLSAWQPLWKTNSLSGTFAYPDRSGSAHLQRYFRVQRVFGP